VTYLLLWLLCPFLTLAIANNKGRNGCGWAVIGTIFGPIGVILALLNPKNPEELERRAVKGGEMKKCSSCAELIRAEAVKCRYCGAEMPLPMVYQDSPLADKLRPK
jgi:hypothetical protein